MKRQPDYLRMRRLDALKRGLLFGEAEFHVSTRVSSLGTRRWVRRVTRLLLPTEVRTVFPHEIDAIQLEVDRGTAYRIVEAHLDRFHDTNCLQAAQLLKFSDVVLSAIEANAHYHLDSLTLADKAVLLRALCYVTKEWDAIPDNRPGGLEDDLREMEEVSSRLSATAGELWRWCLAA